MGGFLFFCRSIEKTNSPSQREARIILGPHFLFYRHRGRGELQPASRVRVSPFGDRKRCQPERQPMTTSASASEQLLLPGPHEPRSESRTL